MNHLLRADELALERVARALRLGGGFAVVVCSEELRPVATAFLRRVSRWRTHRRDVRSAEEVVARLSRTPAPADLELWTVEPPVRDEVWTALNLHREKLPRPGRHVVLWASDTEEAGALARVAPDLWSFRATMVEIHGAPKLPASQEEPAALVLARHLVDGARDAQQRTMALAHLLQTALSVHAAPEVHKARTLLKEDLGLMTLPGPAEIGVNLLLAESVDGSVARRAALEKALHETAKKEGGGAAAAWVGQPAVSTRPTDGFALRAVAKLSDAPVIGKDPRELLRWFDLVPDGGKEGALRVLVLGNRGAVRDAVRVAADLSEHTVRGYSLEWSGEWRKALTSGTFTTGPRRTIVEAAHACWLLVRMGELETARALLPFTGEFVADLRAHLLGEEGKSPQATELLWSDVQRALTVPRPDRIFPAVAHWSERTEESLAEIVHAIATAEARSIALEGDIHRWHSISYAVLAGTFLCSREDTWEQGWSRLQDALEMARREWDDYVPWVVRNLVWVGRDRMDPRVLRTLADEAFPIADASYQRRQEVAIRAGLCCLPDATAGDLGALNEANDRSGHAVLRALSLLAVGRHAVTASIDRAPLLEDAAVRFAGFPWPAKEAEALWALGRVDEARRLLRDYRLHGTLRRLERGFPGLPDFS